MPAINRKRVYQIISLFSAMVLTGLILFLSSAYTQSRFVVRRHREAMVFFDKYLERAKRTEILAGLEAATGGFMEAAGLLPADRGSEPYAYFITDNNYGILSDNDPLTRRYLTEAQSPDFPMFRQIGANFFANELIVSALASSDGRYVFINPDADWQIAMLHAWVHALAARNIPPTLAARMRPDGQWDYQTAQAWRFVDETIALFASDLYHAATVSGSIDAAWLALPRLSQAAYLDPEADIHVRERILRRISRDYQLRTVDYYRSANAFGLHLLNSLGRAGLSRLIGRFLSGDYLDLDDVFADFGGYAAATAAWQQAAMTQD